MTKQNRVSQREPNFRSFNEILDESARQQPTRVAFKLLEYSADDNEIVTYGQLKAQVDFVASVLYSRFNVGERVALFYPTGIEFVVAMLGCLSAGVVAVPIHTPRDLSPAERDQWLSKILEDSQAKAVLTTETLARIMKDRFAGIDIFDPGNFFPDTSQSNFQPTGEFEAMIAYSMDGDGNLWSSHLTHNDLVMRMQLLQSRFGHTDESMIVSCLPAASEQGVLGHVLQPVFAQCTCVFMSPCMVFRKPAKWLSAASEYAATTISAPKSVFETCSASTSDTEPTISLESVASCYSDSTLMATELGQLFCQSFGQFGLSADCLKGFPEWNAIPDSGSSQTFNGSYNISVNN